MEYLLVRHGITESVRTKGDFGERTGEIGICVREDENGAGKNTYSVSEVCGKSL